ncbi:diguanylate cyclase domain-containing protein [Halomonas sp. V046]|uniref:diguanylate cyclase domain-containing protein n=1 Tax=Halomonas sp. V046 TaxID=3459611 RepID=UPI0040450B4C
MARPLSAMLIALLVALSALFAVLLAWYLTQARQYIGADYTGLILDVVRANEETYRLRRLLYAEAREEAFPLGERLVNTATMLQQRLSLYLQTLDRMPLDSLRDAAFAGEIQEALGHHERMTQLIDTSDTALSPAALEAAKTLEQQLAWIFSEMNDRLQSASAVQQRINEGLALAVVVLVGLVLATALGLLAALLHLQHQSETLRGLAITDSLTQLSNRHQWLEQAPLLLEPANMPVALVLLDLDHFKSINDGYGHPTGDQVLEAFGRLLKSVARRSDLVARLGGEEFALLMPHTAGVDAARVGERIRRHTQDFTLPAPAEHHSLTVSIGIAVADTAAVDADRDANDDSEERFSTLYRSADKALYRAKEGGRNRIELA